MSFDPVRPDTPFVTAQYEREKARATTTQASECPGANRFCFGDGNSWLCSLCPKRREDRERNLADRDRLIDEARD